MMKPVFLICGVPGSGKSWVCEQLESTYRYMRHDDYSKENFPELVFQASLSDERSVLADCPFAERELRDRLFERGCNVVPVFIVENPEVCQSRYEAREGRPYPKNFLTRATSIGSRAAEWKAFRGTAEEVLEHLRGLAHE